MRQVKGDRANGAWTDVSIKLQLIHSVLYVLYWQWRCLVTCVCLLCSRWIATPLAVSAGIKQRVHLKAEDNPILEVYYTTRYKNPTQVRQNSTNFNHHYCSHNIYFESMKLQCAHPSFGRQDSCPMQWLRWFKTCLVFWELMLLVLLASAAMKVS